MSIIQDFIANRARKIGFVHRSEIRRTMPPRIARRDFSGADQGRLFADWNPSNSSINDKIQKGLVTMRRRSRDICESNEWAINFIGRCKTNIVGPNGIPFKSRAENPDGSFDKGANSLIEEAWLDWCKKKNCSVDKKLSFTDVLHLLVETEPKDGEFFTRVTRSFPNNEYKFALQIIEADCVDELYHAKLNNGGTIRMGVERNEWKEPVAYWVRKENPNDMMGIVGAQLQRERIVAKTSSGTANIIHKFITTAPNQVRGFPWFAGALESMHMLAAYDEASVVAARTGAAKAGYWKPLPDASGQYPATEDERGNLTQEVSPGQVDIGEPGYEYVGIDPTYPHEQYPAFTKAQLRRIASALRVAYPGLANDLEGVNYSSIRAGMLDEREIWKLYQFNIKQDFCEVVFEAWLEWMLMTQRLNLPLSKLDKFNAPKFICRGWGWVDPEKDVNASILSVKNGFTSRSKIVGENGNDFEEVCQANQHDDQTARDANQTFDGDQEFQEAETLSAQAMSGFITPTMEDEAQLREDLGLPPMSPDAIAAWKKDGGVRKPVAKGGNGQPAPEPKQKPAA